MRVQAKWTIAVTIFVASAALLAGQSQEHSQFELVSTIAFASTRTNPACNPLLAGEIFLMSPNGTNVQRLTNNDGCTHADAFPVLSPDGKKILFDSNRNRLPEEPLNTSGLFLMNTDRTEQTFLVRGGSPTWSPDSKYVAFHASASGTGLPIKADPGAATSDSDIFVMNVDDVLEGQVGPENITNSPLTIDDDPDWSNDGQLIAFTSHPISDNPQFSNTAEIYVATLGGLVPVLSPLTSNTEEERAPSWSPDGTRIVYMCRIGGGTSDFEICVMNADGTGQVQLTNNFVFDGSPTFSPDGQKIVFSRALGGGLGQEVFMMNADGTSQLQLTNTPGFNLLANWGELRVHL